MKTLFLAMLLSFGAFALAEDSVTCANGVSVAWSDDSTVYVAGLRNHQQLDCMEILQKGDVDYVKIENDKTVIRDARLNKVKLTVDNGTSVKSVLIFDWSKFTDGGTVPVEFYFKYPNGTLELDKKIECDAAQS